jgi:pyridoxal phosphate phosphatase PHOSPHO2
MENQKKILLAFDFDHTLIDENSDLSVKKLAPNGQLPESIEAQYSATGWTEYMAAIFKYLHSIEIGHHYYFIECTLFSPWYS